MKRTIWVALMLLALAMLSGCTGVEDALKQVGDSMQAQSAHTSSASETTDWSFVPVVRQMASDTFTAGFPEATITQTGVACRSLDDSRVIVTLEYSMNGKEGSYGFEYERDAQGEYQLIRYGDGVSSDDL